MADADLQTEGGPARLSRSWDKGGVGRVSKKIFSLVKKWGGVRIPRAPPLDPPQFKVMLHGTIRNDDF